MKPLCLTNGKIFTGNVVVDPGAVIIRGSQIEDVVGTERLEKRLKQEEMTILDLKGANVSPGFIDTHIHGLHGFGTASGDEEQILGMSEALVRYGVTSFCPTLYPQDDEAFLFSIRSTVRAMGKETGARIHGLHLEGPFISRFQKGVQKVENMKKVDLDLMKTFDRAAKGHIALMTVAPELKNMRDLALYCSKAEIILSAGHTNATYENMLEGMQAGILHSTHFFNAMKRLHHRNPGAVGAILIHPEISCELIADGTHVHPAIIRLLLRDKPEEKIVLVTDALRPTEQAEGPLVANGEEVYLGEDDRVFHRVSDDVIAGSSLTMIRAVANLVSWGVSLETALKMASLNPARVLRCQNRIGRLLPGQLADITVFDDGFKILFTLVDGEIRYQAE